MTDYTALKQQVLLKGSEEKVEVNQRHLIDKILARYSAEFTVYRELMQNSDDAGATIVEVDFQQGRNTTKCTTVVYRNNGMVFRPQDWARLRTIAEGNPDEAKIGFFGVGFYSVFSVCDEPMIVSGDRILAFTWEGDQLRTRAGESTEDDRTWTTFVFELRDPIDMPDMDEFGRFLVNSLAFTRNVSLVRLTTNKRLVMRLRKALSDPHEAAFFSRKSAGATLWNRLSGSAQLISPRKLFELKTADIRHITLEVDYMKETAAASASSARTQQAESGGDGPETLATAKVQIELGTGTVAVSAGHLAQQMERVTKKRPPSQLSVQVIYSSHTEGAAPLQSEEESKAEADRAASSGILTGAINTVLSFWSRPTPTNQDDSKQEASRANSKAAAFFRDFVPYRDKGRIFIGFATHQTTGASFHVSCPVIPTVERETIDFVDPVLAQWNQELLHVCGTVARIMYEDEFTHLEIPESFRAMATGKPDTSVLALLGHVAHILHTFTFIDSTPLSTVGQLLSDGFYVEAVGRPTVLTGQGLMAADKALLPAHEMGQFMKGVAGVVPDHLYKECKKYFDRLQDRKITRPLYLNDLLSEISSRPLPIEECGRLLQWWGGKVLRTGVDINRVHTRKMMTSVKILPTPDAPPAQAKSLDSYRHYVSPKMIPSDLPLPDTVLPHELAAAINKNDMSAYGTDVESVPSIAEGVLQVVSRYYASTPPAIQSQIVQRLQLLQCVPTTKGMMLPEAAYFPTVTMFKDLPHVVLEHKDKGAGQVSKQLLIALGVRERLALDMVFERLGDLSWDDGQLVKYLVSVQKDLRPEEWHRLKTTAFLAASPQSGSDQAAVPDEPPPPYSSVAPPGPGSASPKAAQSSTQTGRRYRANELYAPADELQGLQLRTLQWHTKWRPASAEAKLVLELGLLTHPDLPELLLLAGGPEPSVRPHALQFLCDNFEKYYSGRYRSICNSIVPFLPCTVATRPDFVLAAGGETVSESGDPGYTDRLCLPNSCYRSTNAQVLGLPVLKQQWQKYSEQLLVATNPPGDQLVKHMATARPTLERARALFAYYSSCHNELSKGNWHQQLSKETFVPVRKGDVTVWKQPMAVYFGTSNSQFSAIFDYVDFGEQGNLFLQACGVKKEPTPLELASALVANPQQVLDAAGGPPGYLEILRECAVRFRTFPTAIKNDMARAQCLLGWQRTERTSAKGGDEVEGDDVLEEGEWRLCRASECSLIDDQILQNIFNPLRAPFEAGLQEMYESLGCKYLSTEVEEKISIKGKATKTETAEKLGQLIARRAPLLLHEYGDSLGRQSDHSGKLKMLQEIPVFEVEQIEKTSIFRTKTNVQTPTTCRGTYGLLKSTCLIVVRKYDFYDVGSVLARIIFQKAKPNQAFLLATFLQTPLSGLKAKGFPVDRLLAKEKEMVQKKVEEARILKQQEEEERRKEEEERLKRAPPPPAYSSGEGKREEGEKEGGAGGMSDAQLAANVRRLQEIFPHVPPQQLAQLLRAENSDHVARVTEKLLQNTPPQDDLKTGDKSRDNSTQQPQQSSASQPSRKQSKGIINRLFSMGGSRGDKDSSRQPDPPVQRPPQPQPLPPAGGGGGGTISRGPGLGGRVDEWGGMDSKGQMLANAVKDAQKWDPNNPLHKANPDDEVPDPTEIPKGEWQCKKPSKPLQLVGKIEGIECYVEEGLDPASTLMAHHPEAMEFVVLLKDMQAVFNLSLNSIHMFYDPPGSSLVAFTTGRALFFNLRCYIEIHHNEPASHRWDAYSFWFMTFCHELAHFFVSAHNQLHGHYMSEFAEHYMKAFFARAVAMGILPA